jgi:hypothetical protein
MIVGTGLGLDCGSVGTCVLVVSPVVTTNSGARLPSLEDRLILTVLPVASTKLYVALPVTMGVTSNSTQVLAASAPLSSMALLVRGGRLFQVMLASVHVLLVVYTAGPLSVPSETYKRSFALVTVPEIPVTVNRK